MVTFVSVPGIMIGNFSTYIPPSVSRGVGCSLLARRRETGMVSSVKIRQGEMTGSGISTSSLYCGTTRGLVRRLR